MVETDGRRLSQAQAGYARGHKPTPSQESNTLSQVSCYTTISQDNITEVAQLTTSADSLATVMNEGTLTPTNSVLQQLPSPSQSGTIGKRPGGNRPAADMREDTRNTKHGGLSHRRNIHLNIDIERCELDNSNVSEDPATPLLLETLKGKNFTAKLPPSCEQSEAPGESVENLSESSQDVPEERIKTFLSFLWLWSGFFATTTSLALTHEKVPDTAPLPDALLDNINYQRWGLDLSEVLLVLNSLIGAVVVFSNIHRLIILRRVWLILGILYYYR